MKLIDEEMVEDLVSSLGLMFLPEKERDEILTRVLNVISARAGAKIISEFSEEEAKEFNAIPKGNLEEMENFIIAKNPQAKDIFKLETEKVKEELLNA